MKRIGYIDGRRVRYVADGVTKFAIHSYGIVMGCVTGSMSLYLAADYGAYITSINAGNLDLAGSNGVRIRVGAAGIVLSVTATEVFTPRNIRLTGTLDVSAAQATLILPTYTSPVTKPGEGAIWYNTTKNKLEFATDTAIETVTSS